MDKRRHPGPGNAYDENIPPGRYFPGDGQGSIQYTGTLIIKGNENITATGTTENLTASSGSDSAGVDLSIDAIWANDVIDSGNITGTVGFKLNPTLPNEGQVAISLQGLTPKFTKNPSTGNWTTPQETVSVSFNYTDANGSTQHFKKSCTLEMRLNDGSLHIDLDLPLSQGRTYSQSFNLSQSNTSN